MPPKGQNHIMEKKLLYWGRSSWTRREIGKLLTGFASTASSKALIPGHPECTTLVLTIQKYHKQVLKNLHES